MKNLTRLSAGLLLAAVVGLSSCVKNEVSDEVKALRQSQVALLNAQVDKILADARHADADAAYQELVNAFKEADDAFTLQKNEATMNTYLATQEALTMAQLKTLEENKLAYEAAVLAYEKFIAEGTFSANVTTYLNNYATVMTTLNTLYGDRIDKQKAIAQAQLLLNIDNLPWDVVKERLEVTLAEKNAELDATNAALPILVAALRDTTTIKDELITLYVMVATLENTRDSLATEIIKANNAKDAADALVDDANLAIGLMENSDALGIGGGEGFIQDELNLLEDSLGYVQDLADANADLVAANATLTLKKSILTAAKSALTAATSAYNTKQALYNTALTNNTNAENDLATKEYLLEVATNNYNAGVAAVPPLSADALQALQDAMDDAQTARDDAYDVIHDADGTLAKLNQAETDRDAAENTMIDAQSDVDDAQDDVDTAQDDVDSAMDDIATANEDLADNAVDLAIIRGKIAEWTPRYDAAVLALPTLVENAGLLAYKSQTITLQRYAVIAQITQYNNVITSLEGNVSAITAQIEDVTSYIEGLEDEITALETQIANNAIDKTWAEGNVTKLQAELAAIEVKITENEALAAYWKKLMDDAIAAQEG